ncbi:MAG: hypothetical protein KDC45_01125, partial [Bacteroidetes bacterium]|nr:hypothetical protein [Bacteroidota bacterium]
LSFCGSIHLTRIMMSFVFIGRILQVISATRSLIILGYIMMTVDSAAEDTTVVPVTVSHDCKAL